MVHEILTYTANHVIGLIVTLVVAVFVKMLHKLLGITVSDQMIRSTINADALIDQWAEKAVLAVEDNFIRYAGGDKSVAKLSAAVAQVLSYAETYGVTIDEAKAEDAVRAAVQRLLAKAEAAITSKLPA